MIHDSWIVAKLRTVGTKFYAPAASFIKKEVVEVVSKPYAEHSTAQRILTRGVNTGKWSTEYVKELEDGTFETVHYEVVAYDKNYEVAGFQGGHHMWGVIKRKPFDKLNYNYSYESCLTDNSSERV